MLNGYARVISVITMFLISPILFAQQPTSTLNLQSGSFDIPLSKTDMSQMSLAEWPEFQGVSYGVISLEKFPKVEEQNTMLTSGIQFLGFLPERFYLVGIEDGANLAVLNSYGVLAAEPFGVDFKSSLQLDEVPNRAQRGKRSIALNLKPFDGMVLSVCASALPSWVDVEAQHPTYGVLTAVIPERRFSELLELPMIEHVAWPFHEAVPDNFSSRTLHRVNFISPKNSNGINYTGEGINVALQDDGTIGPHIDHHGRKTTIAAVNTGDHGDHVGGTIAGAGNLDPRHAGQAPGAHLYVYRVYEAYDSIPSHYPNYDVVITSTSYSDGCNAGYTSRARTMDQQSHDYNSLLHVFSAGNSGTSNCGYGAGNVWGNITGGHKMGKNVIAVANLNEIDGVAASSSRGPAHDGRIKPDLSAKGTSVVSTIENNLYGNKTGTSMAAPGVSGAMAVLYEAYEDFNNELPPGGLIKAIAMNTADDLGNPGPDFIYGWGRVNARKAFEVIQSASYESGSIGQGQELVLNVNVPNNIHNARFMLYWTDPEANVGASTALVNDLDMVVVTSTGDTVQPYYLDPTPNAAILAQPAVQGADHLNNVEQVEVSNPSDGSYQVVINGGLVPQGPQEFFVVYWFQPDELVLTFPVGGESTTPGQQEVIRWDGTNDVDPVTVEYSADGGTSWNTISASVPAGQKHIYWTPPALTDADVHVRLTQNGTQTTSDPFSVMPLPTGLTVDWICVDSLGLVWNSVANASEYIVYRLGEKYMDSVGVSNTTSFTDYGIDPNDPDVWYSVSAVGLDGAKSERAIAINKPTGTFNCILDIDAAVMDILPEEAIHFSCHGDEKEVGFVVRNNSVNPLTAFDASLYLEGSGQVLTESFTANIPTASTDTFFFSSPVSLDGQGNRHYVVMELINDMNVLNDTAERTYIVYDEEAQAPIFMEDFDLMPVCGTASNCEQTTCNILNGWVNAPNGSSDDIDWRLNVGGTPSTTTGPDGDFTINGFGRYLYLEASGGCIFQTANLISPCIDLTESPSAVLRFYYHMFGVDMGNLHVDVFDGETWNLDVMNPLIGNKGDSWFEQEVSLAAFEGKVVNIRFRGITGPEFNSDMAIDGVSIYHPPIADFDHEVDPVNMSVSFVDQSKFGDDMTFDLGDGTVLVNVPASHTYSTVSTYEVTQIVSNDYGTDTFSVVINTLSVDELNQDGWSVFPNPTSNEITVSINEANAYDRWFISDVTGALVMQGDVPSASFKVDVDDLAPGVYMLQIEGASIKECRLIVE